MPVFSRWSNSSLQTIQRCAHQFKLKYLDKNWRKPGPAAARGISVHHVAKETHKRQMTISDLWRGSDPELVETPGTPRSIEEARDLAATVFEKKWDDGITLSPEDLKKGKDLIKATTKDVAVDLSGFYVGTVAQTVKPVAVEREITINSAKIDATLVGYIDLIEDDDGREYIRDLKSAEKKPYGFTDSNPDDKESLIRLGKSDSADNNAQLSLYTMIRFAETKEIPYGQRLVTAVRTPSKHDMTAYVAETSRDYEDLQILGRRLRTAIKSVESGVFLPADPGAPGTPCSWCDYAKDGTCEYVRRGPRTIPSITKEAKTKKKTRYVDLASKED